MSIFKVVNMKMWNGCLFLIFLFQLRIKYVSPGQCIVSLFYLSFFLFFVSFASKNLFRYFLFTACGGKPADVYFLLDSSSSIRPEEFKKQLKFVEDIVDVFDIAANKTRVGVSTFSHDYRSIISLDQYSNKEELKTAIANVTYLGGGTDTGAALQRVREVDFSSARTRREVAHILIVMTDGLSRNPDSTKLQAKLAKTNGTYIFAIGISDNVDEDELSYIASGPDSTVSDFVFSVDNFDALDAIKSVLAIRTCEVAGYQQDQNGKFH